jgi:hypothetical protein
MLACLHFVPSSPEVSPTGVSSSAYYLLASSSLTTPGHRCPRPEPESGILLQLLHLGHGHRAYTPGVGVKAKTLPFAQSLRRVATPTNARRLTRLPFVLSIARRRLDPNKVCWSRVPHLARRPTWNLAHCNRPRVDRQVTGLICNSFSVMTVCNPPLWEYSGDNPGT